MKKEKKMCLIFGIVLLILTIGLIWFYHYQKNILDKGRVNIHSITNSGAKASDVNVYLNATYIAGELASFKNDKKNRFYVIFGDDVQYIVYMKKKDAGNINRYLMDNPDSSYKIYGITRLIPEEMEEFGKEFVKEWLDTNHEHEEDDEHSHEITTEDFYQYFGFIYLDNTYDNFLYWKIIIYLMAILSVLCMGSSFFKKKIF